MTPKRGACCKPGGKDYVSMNFLIISNIKSNNKKGLFGNQRGKDKKLKKGYVIIVDDVINSGKTMQYALVKILEKPTKIIRTMVLVDRKHRRYPIKADIVGISLSTTLKDRVEVDLNKEESKAYLV